MAPNLEQRKDLPQTSGWQSADVVVWDGMRLIVSRPAANFFCPDRQVYSVRFSNRPFGVKRFQTIHYHSVDVARGLVLLFGIGTTALPAWNSKTRWNNLKSGLAIRL
jgi:hypothetical protein